MPTYPEYLAHAASKGFQPMGQEAFDSVIACGFDPIRNTWNESASAKDKTPDDGEFNHQSK